MGAFRGGGRPATTRPVHSGALQQVLMGQIARDDRMSPDMTFYIVYLAAVEREEERMPVAERVVSGTHATGGQSAPKTQSP